MDFKSLMNKDRYRLLRISF